MHVNELMSSPAITCLPTTSVQDVCRLMAEHQVGCVVVVTTDGSLTGIVTDRDLALRVLGQGRSADVPVEVAMTRNVARVSPRDDVDEAERIMAEHHVRRLPVADSYGRVHGMISLDDVVATISRQADEVTHLLHGQPAEHS